jgi:hypothetical protein
MLKKIISNGFTGFESGILGASFVKDISICGYISEEFDREKIDIKGQNLFGLISMKESIENTIKRNLKMSDSCLIYNDNSELYLKYSSKIEELCASYSVPFLVQTSYDRNYETNVMRFFANVKPTHLYIFGIGESIKDKDSHKKNFISFLNILDYMR